MANRTDIDTFEKLNDVSRTIMADGLIGGKRFADIIIEIMQIAAAYGADEARRSAHFFATTKETDFEQQEDEHRHRQPGKDGDAEASPYEMQHGSGLQIGRQT